jgi:hypothetical protein
MSINKNFVVKNGFEVSTDLILADADTRKVGIGTTRPRYDFTVAGGIGATNFYLTGIGTFVEQLNVGPEGTVLTVLGLGNSIGIGTALPAYLLDIRSPVSTGQTALYVQGDVEITGDIRADDLSINDAVIEDLTVTDILFVVGLSTFNSNVFINATLNVSGITTLGDYVDINSSVDIADDLNVVGLTTLGGYVDINNSVDIGVDLNVVGLTTLGGYVDINNSVDIGVDLNVGGATTLGDHVDINSSVDIVDDLNVVGLTTLGGYVDINNSLDIGDDLNVSGVTSTGSLNIGSTQVISGTFELQNITSLDAITIATIEAAIEDAPNNFTDINVSGISTLGTVLVSSGIITATSGIVTYYGDGSNLINIPPGSPSGSNTQVQYNDNGSFAGSSNFTFDGTTVRILSGIVTTISGTNLNYTGIGTITNLIVGNVNSSGIITASSFVGNLTGDATGLSGTPNLNVGVVTAIAFFGDGSGLTGAGSTVFNDTTTDQEFFPLFTDITTGTITASGISTSKLTYNPFTGTLTVIDLNSTSDINLKENIQTVENALETVSSLRGVSFDWKENGKSSYGVIAQELKEILPDLVSNGDVKTVNYNGLIGVLIEAIKELKTEVEELKSKS